MAWEDGTVSQVETLIEAASSGVSKSRARELLTQALNSARVIKDKYKRDNLVALIESKLSSL